MKKLILLCAILLTSSFALVAEEPQASAIVVNQETDNKPALNEATQGMDLYPQNHKTFYLTIDNQIKLLNRLLESKGKPEVIRYFLSLYNHDLAQADEKTGKKAGTKALQVLGKYGAEDLRLVILENLPPIIFADLLNSLFDPIGGEAIAHWGYKNEPISDGKSEINPTLPNEKLYMIPCVRAQQYVNFFMNYNTFTTKEISADGLVRQFTHTKKVWEKPDEEILKARGQKLAEVFKLMDEDNVINLLYGRPDTRFAGQKDRIVQANSRFKLVINNTGYSYQTFEKEGHYSNREEWRDKDENSYNDHTSLSRVPSKSINYIIPHLEKKLIVLIFGKETNSSMDALVTLIKSLGCDRAFNELFEYLADDIKNKVYETCGDDNSLFEMLGLGDDGNAFLALGSGAEKKEEKPEEIPVIGSPTDNTENSEEEKKDL